MWLPNDVISQVDTLARVYYVNMSDCQSWNATRKEGELRLLTGWMWVAKSGGAHQQGLKTQTQCYRDAYYRLVLKSTSPSLLRRSTVRRIA
jgi:hypothetical protein